MIEKFKAIWSARKAVIMHRGNHRASGEPAADVDTEGDHGTAKKPFWMFGLGMILVLLANTRAFSVRSGVTWDARDEMFFYFRWLGSALRQGIWADFNPHVGAGYPIGANPQSGTYNPLYLLFAYLWPDSILSINMIYLSIQLLMFAVTFWLFFRLGFGAFAALASGLAIVASGFFTSHASHFSYLSSALGWTASFLGLLLCFQRRSILGVGILALSVFYLCTTGYPAIWVFGFQVFTLLFLACFVMADRKARFSTEVAGACLLGLVPSIPALLHFVGALALSHRSAGLSVPEVMAGTLVPDSFWNLFVPYLRMTQVPLAIDDTMARFHGVGLTVPMTLLGLYSLGRLKTSSKLFWVTGFAGFLLLTILSFGDHSGLPLRRWLAENFFAFRVGRFPSGEHSFFATLFLVGLGAFGFRFLESLLNSRLKRRWMLTVIAVDFLAVMVATLPFRFMRLPEEMRGQLDRFQVVFQSGDQAAIDAPRGCPFHPNAEFDQRLTPPDKFSWNAYANLMPGKYLAERDSMKWAICGPSRLWRLEGQAPWSYQLELYSPNSIKFTTRATDDRGPILWADVDDGRWGLWINGQRRDFGKGPASLRQIDLEHYLPGEELKIEMSYLGPLSQFWRGRSD